MLYNTHLKTFITVVESGSFRGAAEKIGISPSAVLKQISLLEKDLGIQVFDRSRRGVSLTEAGDSLYRDSRYILKYCDRATAHARELYTKESSVFRLGVSAMNPVDALSERWQLALKKYPCRMCRLIDFEATASGMERAFATLGRDCDGIIGVYDETFLEKHNLRAIKFRDVPAVAAFAPGLFGEDGGEPLSLSDFNGKTLLVPGASSWSLAGDVIASVRGAEEMQIQIEEYGLCSLDLYYRCADRNQVLMTFDVWGGGNLLAETRAVDWGCSASYGLMYSADAPERVTEIVRAME
ncbi:MAG: LysR family transcriptional regulator [Lachnospiraceae bacterium]|nr:LysR family transcriptional regulator [Lachnospiraceae bacterium]